MREGIVLAGGGGEIGVNPARTEFGGGKLSETKSLPDMSLRRFEPVPTATLRGAPHKLRT